MQQRWVPLLLLALLLLAWGWSVRAGGTSAQLTGQDRGGATGASGNAKNLIICIPNEPSDLFWTQRDPAALPVLDTILEPLIDSRDYEYQANLVEKLPSFEDGDARLRKVMIGEGNLFYDALSQQPMVLTRATTERFGLYQANGEVLVIEQWDGRRLPTIQIFARWTLEKGLTWEDGTPVTADDSRFAFELTLNPAWSGDRRLTERTASYTALDERTVQWVSLPGFTESTYFLNLWPPVPRHLYGDLSAQEVTASGQARRQPFGYGPYKLEAWVRGESITLVPNPYYLRGTPPLDRLTFHFVPNPDELLDRLVSGECDLGTQNANLEEVYERLTELVEAGRLRKQEVPGSVFEHLDFNLMPADGYSGAAATLRDNSGGLLFQNLQFRQAVAVCLNRSRLVKDTSNGAAFVRNSYMSAAHLLYPGDQRITIHAHNPAQGRALLAQLGWVDINGDGIVENSAGEPLVIRYLLPRNDSREQVALLIQEQLEACGIALTLEVRDSDFFADGPNGPIFGRQYDMAQFAWVSGVEPPCYLYHSSEIPASRNAWRSSNNTGFANPAFDAACTSALQSLEDTQKAARHAEALALFTEQVPSIPLFARAMIVVYRPEVSGVQLDPTASSDLWNVERFDIRP